MPAMRKEVADSNLYECQPPLFTSYLFSLRTSFQALRAFAHHGLTWYLWQTAHGVFSLRSTSQAKAPTFFFCTQYDSRLAPVFVRVFSLCLFELRFLSKPQIETQLESIESLCRIGLVGLEPTISPL
jgi:hypothetical protein